MDVDPLKSGIELRHFRYFVAVAEELHFGRAAVRLNIVQPGLTAQIKSLERLLGVELLERSNRNVALTDAGREFLRESYAVLAQFGNAITTAKEFARGATGVLRIGYGANAAIAGLLPASIRRFREQWPNVTVTLSEMASSEVATALMNDEIDVGYAAKGQATSKQIASRTMGEWHWLLAVSETHQLAGTGQTSLAEIAEESLAIYAEADGRSDVSSMTTTLPGLSPRRIYRSSHIMSLMTYVSSGLGVAFVPAPIPSLSFPGVAFVAIEDPLPKLQMELLWSVDGASAAVVNYLDCAEEAKVPAYR